MGFYLVTVILGNEHLSSIVQSFENFWGLPKEFFSEVFLLILSRILSLKLITSYHTFQKTILKIFPHICLTKVANFWFVTKILSFLGISNIVNFPILTLCSLYSYFQHFTKRRIPISLKFHTKLIYKKGPNKHLPVQKSPIETQEKDVQHVQSQQ